MEIKGIRLPEGLGEETVRDMEDIIGKLEAQGRLDIYDGTILRGLAVQMELSNRLRDITLASDSLVTTTAGGSEVIIPSAREFRQYQALITTQLKEMGLTLKSRSTMERLNTEEESQLAEALKSLD